MATGQYVSSFTLSSYYRPLILPCSLEVQPTSSLSSTLQASVPLDSRRMAKTTISTTPKSSRRPPCLSSSLLFAPKCRIPLQNPLSLSPFLSFSLSLFDHPRFGASKKVAICLGTGKISTVLNTINRTHHFFDHILQVEHPRYIVQYKRARINEYPSTIILYIFLGDTFDFKIDI